MIQWVKSEGLSESCFFFFFSSPQLKDAHVCGYDLVILIQLYFFKYVIKTTTYAFASYLLPRITLLHTWRTTFDVNVYLPPISDRLFEKILIFAKREWIASFRRSIDFFVGIKENWNTIITYEKISSCFGLSYITVLPDWDEIQILFQRVLFSVYKLSFSDA